MPARPPRGNPRWRIRTRPSATADKAGLDPHYPSSNSAKPARNHAVGEIAQASGADRHRNTRVLRDERADCASSDDPLLAFYRTVARLLRQPLPVALPADFTRELAERVVAQHGFAAQAPLDLRFKQALVRSLVVVLALSAAVATALLWPRLHAGARCTDAGIVQCRGPRLGLGVGRVRRLVMVARVAADRIAAATLQFRKTTRLQIAAPTRTLTARRAWRRRITGI